MPEIINLQVEKKSTAGILITGTEAYFMGTGLEQRPLREATIYVTQGCNLKCSFCFVKDTPKKPISKADIRSTLEVMKKYGQENISVRLFGGEPLLYPKLCAYIVKLFRQNYGQHVNFVINTNLTLLDKKMAELIYFENIAVITSIHNQGQPGLAKTKNAIELLHKLGHFKISANCVFSKYNNPDLKEHFGLLKALGIKGAGISYDMESLSIEEYAKIILQARKLGKEYGIPVGRYSDEELQRRHSSNGNKYCYSCGNMISVSSNGRVFPCHRQAVDKKLEKQFDCGLISEFNPLESKLFMTFNQRIPDNMAVCKDCDYDLKKVCRGGCCHASLLKHNDIFKPAECDVWKAVLNEGIKFGNSNN